MNRKAIAKIAGFLAGLVILLEIAGIFFNGGLWYQKRYIYDRNARMAAFFLEKPGQIDVVNFGDSLSTTALAPLELFRDYGITAYDMGQDGQTPVESFFAIIAASKKHPIKVALFEVHDLFKVENNYDFPQDFLAEFYRTEFPFLRYHYVWMSIWKRKGIRKYYKGFLVNDGHDSYSGGEYYDWGSEERCSMFEDHKTMLRWMADYCKRHGIKLVLYSAPSPVCYDISMHNTISDLAGELGLDYIDANYDRDKLTIDWKKDTHDCGDHLNLSGSRKMTKYLGDYLSANCDLTDHRGDPAYQEWTDIWPDYEETIKEMKGTYYSILEDQLGFDD